MTTPRGRVSRPSDVDPRNRLVVVWNESGDISLSIITNELVSQEIVFCPGSVGGGKSPNTWRAAVDLFRNMRDDDDLDASRNPHAFESLQAIASKTAVALDNAILGRQYTLLPLSALVGYLDHYLEHQQFEPRTSRIFIAFFKAAYEQGRSERLLCSDDDFKQGVRAIADRLKAAQTHLDGGAYRTTQDLEDLRDLCVALSRCASSNAVDNW